MRDQLPTLGTLTTEDIDGLRVRIARKRGKAGIPVVLFSPWPESIFGFRNIISIVSQAGPVISVDLPGFGRSEGRTDLMSPSAMGDFIKLLATYLKVDRMHAIGPDIGTLALLFAASSAPTLFESLILGSGGTSLPLVGKGLDDLIRSPVGAFENLEGGGLALGFVRQSASRPIPEAVLEDYRLSSAGRRFEDATNFVRAYLHDLPTLEDLLRTLATPTLIISSTHDVMVPPSNGDFLHDRLPHSKHVVLEGGHLIWEDAAEEYGRLSFEWINGNYRTV